MSLYMTNAMRAQFTKEEECRITTGLRANACVYVDVSVGPSFQAHPFLDSTSLSGVIPCLSPFLRTGIVTEFVCVLPPPRPSSHSSVPP